MCYFILRLKPETLKFCVGVVRVTGVHVRWCMCKVVRRAEIVAGSGQGQSMFDDVSFAQKSEYTAPIRAVQSSKCHCLLYLIFVST